MILINHELGRRRIRTLTKSRSAVPTPTYQHLDNLQSTQSPRILNAQNPWQACRRVRQQQVWQVVFLYTFMACPLPCVGPDVGALLGASVGPGVGAEQTGMAQVTGDRQTQSSATILAHSSIVYVRQANVALASRNSIQQQPCM